MRVRRCTHLMFEPREALTLDLDSLAAGGDGLRSERTLLALAPHLQRECELTPAELVTIAAIPCASWSELAALEREHDPALLQALIGYGLLVCEDDTDDTARDERLRAANWQTLSAVQHYFNRWDGVRTGEETQRSGYATLTELIAKLGQPPPAVQPQTNTAEALPLPVPAHTAFDELLQRRATCRNFDTTATLSAAHLSTLLSRVFGAQGSLSVGGAAATTVLKRNSPSGGGLHPIGAYLLVQRVEDLAAGLYHYEPVAHALQPLRELAADAAADLASRSLAAQEYFAAAPVMFVLAVRFPRSFWKYRNHAKAYRVGLLDAGHLSQTLYLSATDLGLGAFVTAAINEVEIEQALGLDPLTEGVLAICGCGARAAQRVQPEFDPRGTVWRDDGSRRDD